MKITKTPGNRAILLKAAQDISGALAVQGLPSHRVVFTSYKDDANGGDTNHDGSATSPPHRIGEISFWVTTALALRDSARFSRNGAIMGK
jgi:hypothetical protein